MQWFVIERFGRRFLTLAGIFGLTALLLAAGIAATVGGLYANRATISFVLVTCFYWNFTIGATSKVAMAEIGTSRLRNKTAGFGVAMQGTLAVRHCPLLKLCISDFPFRRFGTLSCLICSTPTQEICKGSARLFLGAHQSSAVSMFGSVIRRPKVDRSRRWTKCL